MDIVLTDDNIRHYIKLYMEDPTSLPEDLGVDDIGKWDVRHITTMRGLFQPYPTFNEPLGMWQTGKVKDMSYMFAGCSMFNQSLEFWDVGQVEDMQHMFEHCESFDNLGKPMNWDVSRVTNMERMFSFCESFNQSLDRWIVNKVETMGGMFHSCASFNQPLDRWEVDQVKSMEGMFYDCVSFNQTLETWNVSQVKTMTGMFAYCARFNQPLPWEVNHVTDMSIMFLGCSVFNQPLPWNVSQVTDMESMFNGCLRFNQPLVWNVSNVTKMPLMFVDCHVFNQPLLWNVSRLTNCRSMFSGCHRFNQPLPWDVSNVETMNTMFMDCRGFNQPLNHWDVRQVTDMQSMFLGCNRFNQPLNKWDVRRVTTMRNMFSECDHFNQPLFNWDVRNADITDMFHRCPNIEELNIVNKDVIVPSRLNHVGSRIKRGTVYDIIEGESDLNPASLNAHLADKDNILLIFDTSTTSQHLFLSRDILESQINMNDGSNGVVFVCREVFRTLNITDDLLRNLNPYFNLRKIALTGFVLASQIQAIIRDTNQIYRLRETEVVPSTVSWGVYKRMTNLVSAAHCQEGMGGSVYNIEIVGIPDFRNLHTTRKTGVGIGKLPNGPSEYRVNRTLNNFLGAELRPDPSGGKRKKRTKKRRS